MQVDIETSGRRAHKECPSAPGGCCPNDWGISHAQHHASACETSKRLKPQTGIAGKMSASFQNNLCALNEYPQKFSRLLHPSSIANENLRHFGSRHCHLRRSVRDFVIVVMEIGWTDGHPACVGNGGQCHGARHGVVCLAFSNWQSLQNHQVKSAIGARRQLK